jgi:predicted dehydrogenase
MTTVAIIGYGYWGPNLLRNYVELPTASLEGGCRVKYVCDLRSEQLARAQARYPAVQTTSSYEQVIDDPEIDAVVIATPISTHHPLAAAALRAGKHVFVEKPIAASSAEAAELCRLAAAGGLTLMVGHTFVYSPPVRKVKQIIDSGELGEIRFVTSQRVNLGLHQKDVSVIWDLATHDLSILDYWLGDGHRAPQEAAAPHGHGTPPDDVVAVSVTGRACVRRHIPDVAFVNLRFRSGVVALAHVSWLSPVKLRRTVVVGSKKMVLYDDTAADEKVRLYDHGVHYAEPTTFEEFELTYHTGDIVAPRLDTTEPLRAEALHFLECVETGRPPLSDGAAGLRVVKVLEAAEESLRGDSCLVEVEPAAECGAHLRAADGGRGEAAADGGRGEAAAEPAAAPDAAGSRLHVVQPDAAGAARRPDQPDRSDRSV